MKSNADLLPMLASPGLVVKFKLQAEKSHDCSGDIKVGLQKLDSAIFISVF